MEEQIQRSSAWPIGSAAGDPQPYGSMSDMIIINICILSYFRVLWMYVCERVKRYLVVCGEGVGAGVARRRRSAAQQLRLGMAEVQHQSGTTTATAAAVVAVVVVVVAVVVAVVAVIVIVVAGAMATEAVVGRLVGCAG